MSRPYGRSTCHVCKQEITNAGAARAAHMRKHARAGLLIEGKDRDDLVTFRKPSNLERDLKAILNMDR